MFHRDVDDVASRKSRPTPAQAKAHAWVERHHRRRTLSLSDKSDASDRIDVASAKGVQEQVNAELLAGVISLETPGAGKTDKPDISACDIIHAEPILMENYAVDDDDQLQAQVRSCTLDDVHEMKVGVGVFSKEDMQLLSQMFHAQLRTSPEGNPGEDASYGVSKLMHRESFVDILCRFLGSDVHREPRSYASRLFDSFTYVDGTVGTGSGLQFEQFVKGLAAMDPHAPDTSDRLRYVFRVYASSNDDTSPAVLWFNDFKCMYCYLRMYVRRHTQSVDAFVSFLYLYFLVYCVKEFVKACFVPQLMCLHHTAKRCTLSIYVLLCVFAGCETF
eukprot:m.299654 g.299654  ORF g.299654 m.299654 type:complete len:332 (+) comp20117_c0_seq1:448-1443(+)